VVGLGVGDFGEIGELREPESWRIPFA